MEEKRAEQARPLQNDCDNDCDRDESRKANALLGVGCVSEQRQPVQVYTKLAAKWDSRGDRETERRCDAMRCALQSQAKEGLSCSQKRQ